MATFSQWPVRISRIAGVLVLCTGLLVLLGWCFGSSALETILNGWPAMVPATALCFAMAGLSLWLTAHQSARVVSQSFAVIVAATALLRLACHIAGWHAPWDYLAFRVPLAGGVPAGSMSPATAFDFLLLASALLLAQRKRVFGLFQTLVFLGGVTAWLGFSRYFYGGQPLLPLAQMAAHTALALLILSAGVLCLRQDRGLVGLLFSDGVGGTTARRLMPTAMAVPFIFGWLRLHVQNLGWLRPEADV